LNRFTQEVAGTDAPLVVTPEFNRSIPAVLKNAIDWGSKPMDRNVWKGKVAAISGTSPGAIGTAAPFLEYDSSDGGAAAVDEFFVVAWYDHAVVVPPEIRHVADRLQCIADPFPMIMRKW
jgi:NADPH-dependent FMN reductase